jgi:hypothetical protein
MMKTRVLLALAMLALSLHAQLPEDLIQRERARLLAGVGLLPKAGVPGPLAIWGDRAFPVLTAADRDGVESALVAAAVHGKGRVVLFSHDAYLEGLVGGGNRTLLENSLRWVGKKKSPRVGVVAVRGIEWLKEDAGFDLEPVENLTPSGLKKYDVLLLNAQGQDDPEAGKAIIQFVKAGGGLVAAMTGWAFDQTSGGKDLTATHGLNHALMPVGIAFTDMIAFDDVDAFAPEAEPSALVNAGEAIAVIGRQTTGGEELSGEEMKQASHAIQIAMAAQAPGRDQFQAAVLAAMGEEKDPEAIPTAQTPWTSAQHSTERLRLGMMTRVLSMAQGPELAAHPAHVAFPGAVAADVPRGQGQVEVNPHIPGWTSTGWYAAAGDSITITLPEAIAGKGYAVRIGCHSDTLYHLDQWERAPAITRTVPLESAVTTTSSAFGGLIYIVVPDRKEASEAAFSVSIANAVAAPLFVLGQHDDVRWNRDIKKRPAPWAELACDNLIVSCPAEVARTVNNPSQLMRFWKAVVEAQDDIANQAAERRRPERIVADVQISAGYMHSGYPIMIPTSAAPEMVTYGRLKFPGWGFYHEIGHNHQRPYFTFDGSGEVTNNVIGMYCYEAVLRKDWLIGHTAITAEERQKNIEIIESLPQAEKWQRWKSEPFLALTTYIQLVQAFGWENWRAYLHSFADESLGPVPDTDEEARDQFLIRYSKLVKKNLGPFFDYWGIPVSEAAKDQVANLDPWMPGKA